jgi:hypothetical protein
MVLSLAYLGRTNTTTVVVKVVRLHLFKWHAIYSANSLGGLKNTRSPLKTLSKTESLGEE